MKARFVVMSIACASWVLTSATAVAQDAQDAEPAEQTVPAPPSAPASPPLDVVVTHDGGMVRGTIIESVPGQYVIIALPTGETRRFDGAQVRYAGPRSGQPDAAPATSPEPLTAATSNPAPRAEEAEGATMELRLESPQAGVTFHRVRFTSTAQITGSGFVQGRAVSVGGTARGHTFERLCAAPCQVELPPGEYELALSAGGDPIVAEEVLRLDRPTVASGVYTDNSGLRAAGWVTIIGGALAGAAIILVPTLTGADIVGNPSSFWVPVGVGIGVVTLAGIIGWILTAQGDGATIRFD